MVRSKTMRRKMRRTRRTLKQRGGAGFFSSFWPFGQNASNRRVEPFTRNTSLLSRPASTPATREKIAAALAAARAPGNLRQGLTFSNTAKLNNGSTVPTSRGSRNTKRPFGRKEYAGNVYENVPSSNLWYTSKNKAIATNAAVTAAALGVSPNYEDDDYANNSEEGIHFPLPETEAGPYSLGNRQLKAYRATQNLYPERNNIHTLPQFTRS